jgi:hypothetical protein
MLDYRSVPLVIMAAVYSYQSPVEENEQNQGEKYLFCFPLILWKQHPVAVD